MVGDSICRHPLVTLGKKLMSTPYAVNINDSCVAFKTAEHSLYTCTTFQAFWLKQKMGLVKDNELCTSCLDMDIS